jgi:hypothetical protein
MWPVDGFDCEYDRDMLIVPPSRTTLLFPLCIDAAVVFDDCELRCCLLPLLDSHTWCESERVAT